MIHMTDFIAELEPSFYRDCKYRQLVDLSIRNYVRTLSVYRKWLVERGYPVDATALEYARYDEWSKWLRLNRAASTANLYLLLVCMFSKWAAAEGEIDVQLKLIKFPLDPRKPKVMDDDILTALLKATQTYYKRKWMQLRAEVIVRLLLDTGIRRSELTGLKLTDIDLKDLSAKVTGKGGKTRFVYFGNNTARAIDRYLRVRHNFSKSGLPWLLVGQKGQLQGAGIKYILYRLCEQAEVKRTHPHAFRHTFCHDWLDSGGSPRDLQRIAGWTTTAMLEVYGAEKADQRASNAHRRLSRGDRV